MKDVPVSTKRAGAAERLGVPLELGSPAERLRAPAELGLPAERFGLRAEEGLGLSRRSLLRGAAALGVGSLLGQRAASGAAPDPGPASARGRVSASRAPKKVSLRLNWTAKGEFTPLYFAREAGFFADQGLDVELREGKSGTQAVQVVGAGSDQFGYVPSVQVVQGINQGIPIQVTGTYGRVTGMCWASWPQVPLDGPRSLEGRKVSVSSASTFFQVWPAFVKKYGIDLSKVEAINADPSARVGLFLSKRLEIMADIFIANDFVVLQSKVKEKLNLLRLSDLDFDPVGYVLIANRAFLQSDPDLVRKFSLALRKGFQAMVDDPKAAIATMTKLYGDRLGADVIEGQVSRLLPLVNHGPALGVSNETDWTRSLDLLQAAGVIDKKLALKEYFTNEFVRA
jgi:NitT/TauT family transport system substrate-binding protein